MSPKLGSRYQSLIRKYLEVYRDLHYGRRAPKTALQKHFVDLANGRTKMIITIHERAYLSYLADQKEKAALADRNKRVSHKPKIIVRNVPPLCNTQPPQTYKRFIHEPWGSRSAWKRDSAANRSNASKYKF